MTILVTGGTGFVGAATVDHLAAAGEEVVVLAAPAPEPGWLPESVAVTIGDVRDGDGLRTLMSAHRFSAVIHATAITAGRDMQRAHPERIVSVNVGSTAAAMRAAAEAGCPRVVIASSASVCGISRATALIFAHQSACLAFAAPAAAAFTTGTTFAVDASWLADG